MNRGVLRLIPNLLEPSVLAAMQMSRVELDFLNVVAYSIISWGI